MRTPVEANEESLQKLSKTVAIVRRITEIPVYTFFANAPRRNMCSNMLHFCQNKPSYKHVVTSHTRAQMSLGEADRTACVRRLLNVNVISFLFT